MKHIYTAFLFTLLAATAFSQEQKHKFITGNDLLTYGLSFIAGTAQGTEEAIKFHYSFGFKGAFPHANDQFWDPRVSWHNKYTSKFPLASSVFAFGTDGYHLTRFVSRTALMTTVAFSMNDFKGLTKKQKVGMIAKKFVLSMLSNRLGQYLTYDVLFKERGLK